MKYEQIILGDSNVHQCEVRRYWPGALNAGVDGQSSVEIVARLPALLSANPRVPVVNMMGTNNANNQAGADQLAADYRTAHIACAAAGSPYIAVLPPPRAWLITALPLAVIAMCVAHGYPSPVDVFHAFLLPDGVNQDPQYFRPEEVAIGNGTHFNELGRRKWASMISARLHALKLRRDDLVDLLLERG